MKRKKHTPKGNVTRQYLLQEIGTHLSAVVSDGNNAGGRVAVELSEVLQSLDLADLAVIEFHLRNQEPIDGLKLFAILDIAQSMSMAWGIRFGLVETEGAGETGDGSLSQSETASDTGDHPEPHPVGLN